MVNEHATGIPRYDLFHFLASHDGIGLRPIEGILSDQERDRMIDTLQSFGALLSWKRDADGVESVYEINVSLLDALSGTEHSGVDSCNAFF